jgi:molybdopterin-binding protein
MKLSARNAISGTVVDVIKGETTAHVQLDIGDGQIMTASITNEAVDELKLAKGQKARAVIKASDVMIANDWRRFVDDPRALGPHRMSLMPSMEMSGFHSSSFENWA